MSAVTQDIQLHAFRDLAEGMQQQMFFGGQDVLRLEWFQCYRDSSEALVRPKKLAK